MLAFDHRCHVPDEGLKTDFIPAIRQCFDTLLGFRMPELQARYEMPRSVLKPFLRRAWLMRTRGFEKTLELAYLNKPYKTDRACPHRALPLLSSTTDLTNRERGT